MAEFKIDLTQLFKTYADKYVKKMTELVHRKRDLRNSAYSPIKHPRKGRSAKSRLNDTGNFRENYVDSEYTKDSLTIKGNASNHSSGRVSYTDIINYNNRNSGFTNDGIVNPPLIFPNRPQDIQQSRELAMLNQKFEEDVVKAIQIQSGNMLPAKLSYEIKVL